MTWVEYNAARQLLAEEAIGSRLRAYQRAEDRAAAATIDALRRQGVTNGAR